jgi:hypothetical protein
MTKSQAVQCLDAVREGRFQPKPRINEALRMTGDLPPLAPIVSRRMPNFGRTSKAPV